MKLLPGLRLAVLASVTILLTGCFVVTPKVPETATPTPGDAYIFGRFAMTDGSSAYKNNLQSHIALQLTRDDAISGSPAINIALQFPPDRPVYAIAVRPGTYHLQGWKMSNGMKSKDFAPDNKELVKPFKVEAGQAYYLGDFVGESSVLPMDNKIHYHWWITQINYEFDRTDEEFRAAYPLLTQLPHIDVHEKVSISARLRADSTVDKDSGVIFGRFLQRDLSKTNAPDNEVVLVMHHRDTGKLLRIALRSKDPLHAYAVNPGTYVVDGLLVNGEPFGRDLKLMPAEITVGAGEAVYVGDLAFFSSQEETSSGSRKMGSVMPVAWNLQKSEADLRTKLPLLQDWNIRSAQ